MSFYHVLAAWRLSRFQCIDIGEDQVHPEQQMHLRVGSGSHIKFVSYLDLSFLEACHSTFQLLNYAIDLSWPSICGKDAACVRHRC